MPGDVVEFPRTRRHARTSVSRKSSADTRPLLTNLKQAISSQDGRLLPRRMRLMVLRSGASLEDLRTSEAIASSSSPRPDMNSDSCMAANVHEAHIAVKPTCAWSGMEGGLATVHDMHMRTSTKTKPRPKQPKAAPHVATYMRDWREDRGKTLEDMGEVCHKTYNQLSKIERGLQPYKQDILENYARALNCTVVDLLTRTPGEAESILSVWSRTDDRGRATMLAVAGTLPK